VEDDVDVWRYAILELHARNEDDDNDRKCEGFTRWQCPAVCLFICLFICVNARYVKTRAVISIAPH